ncbi:MAG TPA: M3 family oligoendopeptidase, partial [Roseiflexaceae bacterium]|nr:M3 family oligoendopeptidase [Roseiflexaceae bacterium]
MTTTSLPHWDMSVVYESLDAPEFANDVAALMHDIDGLVALFDTHRIDKREPAPLDEQTITAFEATVAALNAIFERVRTLRAYIYSFVATDSRNTQAQARMSEFQQGAVRLWQLATRFTAWIGSLDVDALLERSELAREYPFMLREAQRPAKYLMSPAEEALAAELNVTGGSAWNRLYNNVTSQLLVPIAIDGQTAELPISALRNLAYEPDRDTRRLAYGAELAAWQRAALPLAAALNSIKGEVNTISRRRGWADPLDAALIDNRIDRQTLDAMMQAAHDSFPDFRRYLYAKARMLGLERLAWYDLFAPVGASARAWTYDEAGAFIVEQFGSYSQRMSDFAARAFRERWIDAEPRPGKRDGAFCMPLRGEESRILSNYQPGFKSVLTLAHELGHAYHNLNLARRPELNRDTPSTLAETASIFCETIVRNAVLRHAGPQEQIEILEGALVNACQIVVDITSRFLFEQRVFDGRRQRDLSIDELCGLMEQSQRETYGDGLDESLLHPYMWAAKGHYYNTGNSFYNFPYMFGLLFGMGLYAIYQRDPATFQVGYDDLLASTGMADAATLAARMEIDTRSPAFWRASFDIIRA